MASNKKLRILCLHGYRQDEKGFYLKTGAFRKIVKNQAELFYMSAPNVVPSSTNESTAESKDGTNLESRGWWFSKPVPDRSSSNYDPLDVTHYDTGYDNSLRAVETVFEEKGPFDGILAFSQGACFLSLLCCLQQCQKLPYQFKFAIFVAGFVSKCSHHQAMYDSLKNTSILIPSLHIFGNNDQVIPPEMSKQLFDQYFSSNGATITHTGGHFLPATSKHKASYIQFLSQQLDRVDI